MALEAVNQFQPAALPGGQTPVRPVGSEPVPPELNLLTYVRALWRSRYIIVLVTVLAGISAFFIDRASTPTYLAETKLWVSAPKFSTDTVQWISVQSFRALFENHDVSASVVHELGLDQPPYNLTTFDFMENNVEVTTLRDTSVLLLRVWLPDRQLAARAANRLADRCVELAMRLGHEDLVTARDTLHDRLESASKSLGAAELARDSYRKEAQIELLRKDVETLLDQRGDLRRLTVQIETDQARISRLTEQLKEVPRVDTLTRSIDNDTALLESARAQGVQGGNPLTLQLKDEQVNRVHEQIEQDLAKTRAELAGLEGHRAELVGKLRLQAPALPQLNVMYTRETELARRESTYQLAKTTYFDVAAKLEQLQLLIASRSPQLQVVDQAQPPPRPIAPRPFRAAVMVMAAIFALSAAIVVGRSAVGSNGA
jgi:uncharacterized protein involved in exopolysaccharide biosynthesis